ncbi:hypothetical protein KM043_003945 [Ampulex compressa]|nr:hypothetical protein KM043_003945 [Ampulex compressa]
MTLREGSFPQSAKIDPTPLILVATLVGSCVTYWTNTRVSSSFILEAEEWKDIEMKSWFFGRYGLILPLLFIFCLYFLAFYFDLNIPSFSGFKSRMTPQEPWARIGNDTKTVLFWNTLFGDETFYLGKGDIFKGCPVNDCYATRDRSRLHITAFDAVFFHGNELSAFDLPGERGPKQWYVYVSLESPSNRPLTNALYEDYFNLTMTYRLDSDILLPYGIIVDSKNDEMIAPSMKVDWKALENDTGTTEAEDEEPSALSGLVKGKRKPVTWFVSNCPAQSGRLEYVKELSRHIGVDIYGRCGDKDCPRNRNCMVELVEPDYFFYLSFENSLCQDYVTEKLYNTLRFNVVPVVYGAANYSLMAPPHSYINALDFETPKDLADYLEGLMADTKEYEKYFRWKRRYRVDHGNRQAACRLCELLHRSGERKIYNPLSDWYSRDKCPLEKFLGKRKYATKSTLKNL